MDIRKFVKEGIGEITTITNPQTGVTMYFGKQVAKIWGHTNLTQAIKSAKLSASEYKVIRLAKHPEFKNDLCKHKLVTSKTPTVTMLSESGMYKLALASNLDKAKPFRDWIASEVLPSIRKKGYYSLADQTEKMLIHTNIDVQKQNSKDINQKNLIEHGIEGVIEYNRQNCILHADDSPSNIKKKGRQMGLKASQCTSAKEVLRNIKPAVACAMSFTDSLVKKGFDLKTVSELSKKCAIPLFEGMIEMGITPAELKE